MLDMNSMSFGGHHGLRPGFSRDIPARQMGFDNRLFGASGNLAGRLGDILGRFGFGQKGFNDPGKSAYTPQQPIQPQPAQQQLQQPASDAPLTAMMNDSYSNPFSMSPPGTLGAMLSRQPVY